MKRENMHSKISLNNLQTILLHYTPFKDDSD